MKWLRNIALATVTATVMAGCSYTGINEFKLPGTEGEGNGSYLVKLQMSNVGDLVANNPVRLGDVDVGVIRKIELQGWQPVVTVRLNPGVHLPANATARVGQVSLLGAKYIEISPPKDEPPIGRLVQGSTISLARTGQYPETEDTLAAVATLLNGGGLEQLHTITTELNKSLAGRTPQFRDLLNQLNTLVTGLDAQRGDIVHAIDGVDRLSTRLSQQNRVLDSALRDLPPALATLDRDRSRLVGSLDALGRFGSTFNGVVEQSAGSLATNVSNLTPAVRQVADSGQDLVKSLDLLGTVIFPASRVSEVFRGDYINFWLTLDLSQGTLDRNFLTGTPAQGTLGSVEKALAGTSRPMVNPLLPPGSPVPGAPPLPPEGSTPEPGPAPNPRTHGPGPGGDPAPTPPSTPPGPPPSDGLLGGLLGGR